MFISDILVMAKTWKPQRCCSVGTSRKWDMIDSVLKRNDMEEL